MNETIYKFRFGNSKKTIQITQQQLNHFPYLFTLVNHTYDFSVNKNDDGEYILKRPICYNWFMAIFQSVIKQQPSALFTELSHEANVLRVLELYDYLCIDPLPLPLLKNQNLVLTNPININDASKRIDWRRANICEVRNIAAQFIIGISKNAYILNDSGTRNSIFTLLMDIFSHPNIFHSRFRYHTLKVVEKYCFSLFSDSQQRQLPTTQQIIQNIKIDFVRYLDNENQSLPPNFYSTFAWKGIYVSKDKVDTDFQSILDIYLPKSNIDSVDSTEIDFYFENIELDWEQASYSDFYLEEIEPNWERRSYSNFYVRDRIRPISHPHLRDFIDLITSRNASPYEDVERLQYDLQEEEERKKKEAQSARSGRFNTLPKRPRVDKFKHRSGLKAQKYR
ncbi:unnamed protein product [Adineta steineri]|uniref:Uncharacterized protein n=1 Tax=Adineta steineri TaxID=433720 RepID=A0A813UGM6_9BILA|nr:unnamed protein product [Adineta steineri]CAF1059987.1 unnamed protein product [Adineta steineri]CAF4028674.1 unnamed protein product [Adineta steineri]